MYHLTPVEAMFLVMFLAVLFMVRGTKKAAKKADKKFLYSLPETEEPLRQGYSFLYCMEMRDRDMMYRDGQWVPMYIENDPNNWYLRDMLRKKDIALNKYGRWDFIGKTREKLERNNAI